MGDERHIGQKVGETPHRAQRCFVKENDDAADIQIAENAKRCRHVGARCDGRVGDASVTCAVAEDRGAQENVRRIE